MRSNRQRRVRRSRLPEVVDPLQQRIQHYDSILRVYEAGLNWVTKLKSHTSCVNAVNFSHGGRWMISGGDDLRILLWDMHDTEIKKPQHTFVGPTRNIFELAFTATNKYLLCGGVDAAVRRYDFERIGETFEPGPSDVFRQYSESIRGIAPHIINDELYMTASQDGRLFFHDARARTPVGHLIATQGWAGIQFHPRREHLFLGATDHKNGRITLFDIRKCFGQSPVSSDRELTRYLTSAIGDKPVASHVCDIAFDRSGERFASVNQGYYPVVYSINDSYPIAVCTAARRPTGEPVTPTERNYGTSCTIKHVSFGGPPSSSPLPYSDPKTASSDTDQYIATGSDDFRGYAWHIPSTSYLLSERQEVEAHEDHPTGKFGYKCSAIDTLYVPAHLDKPAWRLGGHQSIVNTARWHPVLPRIATCGIESKVVLHDCANVLQGAEEVHSDKVRKRRVRIGSVMTGETSEEISDDEDKSTIFYFDHTLAQEEADAERRRRPTLASSNEMEEDDSSDSDEEGGGADDWTGGEGGIDESMLARADRMRLAAMFSRILAAAQRRDDDVEEENQDEGGNVSDRLDALLMLAAANGLGNLEEDEEEEDREMDTNE